MHKKILIAMFLTAPVVLTGCFNARQSSQGPILADNRMVNVYLLAGRVGMYVTRFNKEKVEFGDSRNTVNFYLDTNQVYVNNRYIGPIGRTKKIDGMISVRPGLEEQIRKALPSKIPEFVKPAPSVQLRPSIISPKNHSGKLIVIDAGHGGKDPGAISPYGYDEKTVNLDVALKIAKMLRNRGYKVILTRGSDRFIELDERAAIANRKHADLFVSIHADSCASRTMNGSTVYVSRSASRASRGLAMAIGSRMAKTGLRSKGTRQADYRVLTHTHCPAVLVEMGYLSNYWEAKKLKNDQMQQKIAVAITAGIEDYTDR